VHIFPACIKAIQVKTTESVAEPRRKKEGKLLRVLGITFGFAVTIGTMIGIGILRTPGIVAAELQNVALVIAVWVIGGIYAFLGTVCVTELGTIFPEAGGWYIYARRAFGDYGGFVVGWSNWIAFCTALAFLATAFGDYLRALLPNIAASDKTVGVIVLLLFSFLQWFGLRFGSGIQKLISFIQAIAFLILVAACFLAHVTPTGVSADSGELKTPATWSAMFVAFVLALQAVIFTYDGWYTAIYFAEEDVDPVRNLPRSMIGSVLGVMAFYILIICALLYVLPLAQLAGSQLAAADAAQVIFGRYGKLFITAISIVSILSVINSTILVNSRILFAMSRDRLFLQQATAVNSGGTPTLALAFTTIATILLIVSGTVDRLLAITTFFFVVMYGSGFLSLIILRKRMPELARPFKAWLYPWSAFVVLAISIFFVLGTIISDVINSVYGLLMLVASYPAYLIIKNTEPRPTAPTAI
jgi:basic amino acid/polyamine antiporter, APA family